MLDRLSDPALYVAAAERVRARRSRAGDTTPLCDDGPQLAAMSGRLDVLARRVARDVTRGRYRFGPVSRRSAYIEGKLRDLYVASPLDDIVLGALAEVLAEALQPVWSQALYSYRRGRSPQAAIRALATYLRGHVETRPDPRSRALYVVRRDVRAYGEAIPAGSDSPLWTALEQALRAVSIDPKPAFLAWLRSAFRPRERAGAAEACPERGIPTGSPLQPLACNLYLSSLDAACTAVPDAFYARYGDDVLFAHPDHARALEAMHAIDAALAGLGLELNPTKSAAYYFTGAGRASEHACFRAASSIDYLGMRVEFRGSLSLKREKLRALLGDVRTRLTASARLVAADALTARLAVSDRERACILCEVVNATLDVRAALAHPAAQLIHSLVDDRGQLRDLDYKLARLVAEAASGRSGIRALRVYPPRKLRALGLRSLARARDRAMRHRA